MRGKRVGGVVCLLLVPLCVVAGISSLSGDGGPALTDASGLGVSRAVGAFLPALLVLIAGVWLLQKPASKRPHKTGAAQGQPGGDRVES